MKTLQKILFAIAALFFIAQAHAVMYQARPYDPNLARWISRDPMGEQGGNNLQSFVLNDPVNSFDPDGKWSMKSTIAVVEAIVQIGRVDLGQDVTKAGSPIMEMNKIEEAFEKANAQVLGISEKVEGGAGGVGGPPDNFYKYEGDFKVPAAKFLALSAIGMVAYIGSGQANADAANFVQDAASWTRSMQQGDQAWADLYSADMAVQMLNMTGNENVALTIWGALPDN